MIPADPTYETRLCEHAALRERHGVNQVAPGTHLAVSRDAVAAVLRDVITFTGSFGDVAGMPADEQILQWIPEPRHGAVRRVVSGVIAPQLAPVEAFVRATAVDLLEAALAEGTVDIVSAYTAPLPTRVIAEVFGVPVADAELFRTMSDEFLAAQAASPPTTPIGALHPEFTRYVDRLIADHRSSEAPPDDLITRFIRSDVEGEPLSDTSIRTQMIMLIIAGNETTRNLLSNMLAVVATTPGLITRLRDDPALIDRLIEESLRHDAPVQFLARSCTHAAELVGAAIDQGERVVLSIAAANRDASVFDDPDQLRIDRVNSRDHLAFGAGPHICPGATLARLEARVAIQELVARVDDVRVVADRAVEYNPVEWARGFGSLWVQLMPCQGGGR